MKNPIKRSTIEELIIIEAEQQLRYFLICHFLHFQLTFEKSKTNRKNQATQARGLFGLGVACG